MSIEIGSYAGPIGEKLLTQSRQCLQFNLTNSHSLKLPDLRIPISHSKIRDWSKDKSSQGRELAEFNRSRGIHQERQLNTSAQNDNLSVRKRYNFLCA